MFHVSIFSRKKSIGPKNLGVFDLLSANKMEQGREGVVRVGKWQVEAPSINRFITAYDMVKKFNLVNFS